MQEAHDSQPLIAAAKRTYTSAALLFLTTTLFFIAVNFVLYAVIRVRATRAEAPAYGAEVLLSAYPGRSLGEIRALLRETWSLAVVYEHGVQFREQPFSGIYVNVDSAGFRHSGRATSWPLDTGATNVFVFGGSTTFGYGVADDETIPAYLKRHLSETDESFRVYNFGRGSYYSTQERLLFERLLMRGHIPDVAIFIDGLNDFIRRDDEPYFTGVLTEYLELYYSRARRLTSALTLWLPIGRAALFVRETLEGTSSPTAETSGERGAVADRVIRRWVANRRLIEAAAAVYGVHTLFVWHPVPMYGYDLRYHPFAANGFGDNALAARGYPRMKRLLDANALGSNFWWCAELQRGFKEQLYVDNFHYSAQFSNTLAESLARIILTSEDDGGCLNASRT